MTLLSLSDLENEGFRYSRRHLRRLEAKGLFPKRVRPSPGKVAWISDEIAAHKAAIAAAREPVAA